MDLKHIKEKIERLDKAYQIEIGKILKDHKAAMNENKNGIFINLTDLDEMTIVKITDFLIYVDKQTSVIDTVENIKQEYKDNFFPISSTVNNDSSLTC